MVTPEAAGSAGPAPARGSQQGERLTLAAGKLLQAAANRLRDQEEGLVARNKEWQKQEQEKY